MLLQVGESMNAPSSLLMVHELRFLILMASLTQHCCFFFVCFSVVVFFSVWMTLTFSPSNKWLSLSQRSLMAEFRCNIIYLTFEKEALTIWTRAIDEKAQYEHLEWVTAEEKNTLWTGRRPESSAQKSSIKEVVNGRRSVRPTCAIWQATHAFKKHLLIRQIINRHPYYFYSH